MIELSHIEKRFGDNHVLRDISLSLAEGTVTALVGPSGGGKSTLLRCINLLEIPTSGTLVLGGESLGDVIGVGLVRFEVLRGSECCAGLFAYVRGNGNSDRLFGAVGGRRRLRSLARS